MSHRHLLLIHGRLRFYGFLLSVRNALKNTYAYMTNNFNSSKSIVSICSCSLMIDHIYGRSKKNVDKGDILLGTTLGLWWEWCFKQIMSIQCTSILTHVLYLKGFYFSRSSKQIMILFDSSFRSWFNSVYLYQEEIKLLPVMSSYPPPG